MLATGAILKKWYLNDLTQSRILTLSISLIAASLMLPITYN